MATAKSAKILTLPLRGQSQQPLSGASHDAQEKERRARWTLLALIVAALGLFWGGVVLSHREAVVGLRELPAETRQTLYVETLGELTSVCRGLPAATGILRDHCLEEARFVVQLPECTDACRHTVALILPHARR
jgi:hypothetical protein